TARSLLTGTSCRLGRLPSPRMKAVQRKILMNQLNFAVILRKKLIKGRLNFLAKWTLKILELDDRNRRLLRTSERLASYGELGAENRPGFQVSDDFGFGAEGLEE